MAGRWQGVAGKVVVITGAGGGIGAATARALAAKGAQLVLIDVKGAELAQLGPELGGQALWSRAVDVRSEESLREVARALAEKGLGVDVLINNAAVYAQGPLLELALQDFEWCVDVNLHGPVRCCRVFVPLMRGRQGAQIVNVLSEFAWLPFPNKASYCVSKSAMAMASACLRTELASAGIRVTDFVPPAVETGLLRDAKAMDARMVEREQGVLRAHAKPVGDVAKAIVSVIERPRDEVVYGMATRLAVRAARLAPGLARWGAARMARKLGLA